MEPEDSLLCSQELTVGPYLKPVPVVTDHTTIIVGNQLQAPSFYDVLGVWGAKVG
jgi:hypothetical protein